jgi:hypothetical protein
LEIFNATIFGEEANIEDLTFKFPHFKGQIQMDITPAQIKVHNLDIACWTLLEDHQVRFFNLGTINNPQKIKPKAMLDESITKNIKAMLQEYKDIFA